MQCPPPELADLAVPPSCYEHDRSPTPVYALSYVTTRIIISQYAVYNLSCLAV
jgi:hypothetical protein